MRLFFTPEVHFLLEPSMATLVGIHDPRIERHTAIITACQ